MLKGKPSSLALIKLSKIMLWHIHWINVQQGSVLYIDQGYMLNMLVDAGQFTVT